MKGFRAATGRGLPQQLSQRSPWSSGGPFPEGLQPLGLKGPEARRNMRPLWSLRLPGLRTLPWQVSSASQVWPNDHDHSKHASTCLNWVEQVDEFDHWPMSRFFCFITRSISYPSPKSAATIVASGVQMLLRHCMTLRTALFDHCGFCSFAFMIEICSVQPCGEWGPDPTWQASARCQHCAVKVSHS